jgi:hypothetical protein
MAFDTNFRGQLINRRPQVGISSHPSILTFLDPISCPHINASISCLIQCMHFVHPSILHQIFGLGMFYISDNEANDNICKYLLFIILVDMREETYISEICCVYIRCSTDVNGG